MNFHKKGIDMDDFNEVITEENVYNIGNTSTSKLSPVEQVKNTIRLVAYDICDHKRLRLVARACIDYGVRVEKSVFECDLDDKVFERFWNHLLKIIDTKEDSLVAYKICRACIKDVRSAGIFERPRTHNAYIF